MVFVDHSAVCRPCRRTHLHRSVQSPNRIRLPVIRIDQVSLVSFQNWPNGSLWGGVLLTGRTSHERQRKQHNVVESEPDGRASQSFLLLCSETKKLSGCRSEVNARSGGKVLSRAGNLDWQLLQGAPRAANYFRGPQLIAQHRQKAGFKIAHAAKKVARKRG